ncbi:MAG TPA: nucleotide exchange factor GrpE [Polyangiales bacterium]|jgi:molecular chaperone GrpE|nr:nucleotide exchange factor GrpE [Polyangiales bacterium]
MSEDEGEKPTDEGAEGADEDLIFPEEEAADEPTDLEKAHAERDRMRDQLLRVAADFDNFRKRSRKEIEEVRRRTIEDTLREVLPIVDNLERAADAMSTATEVSAVTDGVHMVLRGFEDIAGRLGLKRVATVGHQFDPTCHDAVQQEETNEHAPGTIVSEVVPGYYLGERLLRPAMVVVAKPPAKTEDPVVGEA